MKANQLVAAVVKVRWKNDIPPTLKDGGWEMSVDGGLTWKPASRTEVVTQTGLVMWN